MRRKVFIGLDLPEKTVRRLEKIREKWPDLPVRWNKAGSFHVTLVFLGWVDEGALDEISRKVSQATAHNPVFDMSFSQIGLFPEASEPRLVALLGEASEGLKNLVNAIEKELKISVAPKKKFRPHITLGRIRPSQWKNLSSQPVLEEKFPLILEVAEVKIMASDFSESAGEYVAIENCPLG